MVASCWLFLNDLYYDARIQEHQVPRLFLTNRYSVNLEKSVSFKVAITEMYPRIP